MEDFEAYIEQLFKKLYTPLVNYSNKFVKDTEAATEVVQNSFVCILEKGRLQITTSEEAYLYAAVRNRSLNYLKSIYVTTRPYVLESYMSLILRLKILIFKE